MRITNSVTTKLDRYMSLVMFSTWLDCREILLETFFFLYFFKILDVFSRSNTISHISRMIGLIDVKQKGSASVGYWVNMTLTFDLTHDLDFLKSNFDIAISRELLVWCQAKRKWINKILGCLHDLAFWPHPWPWPGSFKIKIALSEEWEWVGVGGF